MFLGAQKLHCVVKRSLYECFERRLCKRPHHVLPRYFYIAFRRKREQCLLIQHNLFLAGTDMLFDSRGALLSPSDLKQRLKQLQDCFDYVLIDAPASSVCGDAIALGQIADAAILIIEANKTRRLIARRAKETLEASGVRLLGTVLRNQSFPVPKSLLKRL